MIIRNRKISKILGPVLGAAIFMFMFGILEVPASATYVKSTASDYAYVADNTSTASKDYFININKSAEQNGLKVTLVNAIATKHKLKATIKIESNKPFDQNKDDNSIVQLLYGENHHGGRGMSNDYIDANTQLITIEQDNEDDEFPEKGDIRLDVVYPNYKVNLGIDAKVDFSEYFNKAIQKDLSIKVSDSKNTLNKFESDVLGSTLTYTGPQEDREDRLVDSSMVLKAGDRMYRLRQSGSSSDGKIEKGTYESKAATYDKIMDEKNISIIPIYCDLTWDEISASYDTANQNKVPDKETISNVKFDKYIKFSDGSKGEIYNIERNDNSVKIYCKGASEKAGLLMASSMFMHYQYVEGQVNYRNYYADSNMSFYKDPNDALGYIVEFSNVEKDKGVDLMYWDHIKEIDRYQVQKEIVIAK